MENKLRLLLIEDEEDDALILVRSLEKEGYQMIFLRIQTADEMEKALDLQEWDLIICDYRMPSFSGADALAIYQRKGLDIPFILLSGTVGEEIAVNMMKAGAHDYIMKEHIGRLGPAIKRELADAETRWQRRIALEELRIAKERAEQSDKLKLNLLSSLSHEFRTPMNGILGFAQIIETETNEPVSRKNAGNIYHSGQRLMKTLDSILWLAQLDSGLQPNFSSFNLKTYLLLILNPYQELAKKKNLDFVLESDPELSIITDQNLLREALINLVDNAVKFTREGSVKVKASIDGEMPFKKIIITVQDSGIGILPENFSIIFEAFRQVSEGIGRQYEGSGLGLTIVKKTVEILGGEMKLDSNAQTGSIFTISIPCQQTPDILPPPLTYPSQPDKKSKLEPEKESAQYPSVLVVEDNELNTELMVAYLRNLCVTDHAIDAESAIRMAKEKQYQAILMDINLGKGMDGLQATEIIRKIEGYKKVPIIAVTGYTLYGDKERILSRGCSDYLPKPFTKEDLTRLFKKVIK